MNAHFLRNTIWRSGIFWWLCSLEGGRETDRLLVQNKQEPQTLMYTYVCIRNCWVQPEGLATFEASSWSFGSGATSIVVHGGSSFHQSFKTMEVSNILYLVLHVYLTAPQPQPRTFLQRQHSRPSANLGLEPHFKLQTSKNTMGRKKYRNHWRQWNVYVHHHACSCSELIFQMCRWLGDAAKAL